MLRLRDALSTIAILAFSLPCRAAPVSPPPPHAARASRSAAVAEHVSRAERAQRAKRWGEAIEAYNAALDEARKAGLSKEETAALWGELGVCEVALQRYRDAAEHLQRSLESSGPALGRARAERFQSAQHQAESEVATLFIAANPSDAEIFIDGKRIGAGESNYMVFVESGRHTVRAHLHGHSDALQTIEPGRGQQVGVSMRLSPPMLVPIRVPESTEKTTSRAAAEHQPDTSSDLGFRNPDGSWGTASVMPLMALGFTPRLSPGVSFDFAWRRAPFSLGAEARALTSDAVSHDATVRTVRAQMQVSGCGHYSVFYLCGLFGFSGLVVLKDPVIRQIETDDPMSLTAGIRPGIEWRFVERLALRSYVELQAVIGQSTIWVDGEEFWAAPPLAGVLGVGLTYPFEGQVQNGSTANTAYRSGARVR